MSAKLKILVTFLIAPAFGLIVQMFNFFIFSNNDFKAYLLDLSLTRAQVVSGIIANKQIEISKIISLYKKGILDLSTDPSYQGHASRGGEINVSKQLVGLNKEFVSRLFQTSKDIDYLPFFHHENLFLSAKTSNDQILFFSLENTQDILNRLKPFGISFISKAGLYSTNVVENEEKQSLFKNSILEKLSATPVPSSFQIDVNNSNWYFGATIVKNSQILVLSNLDEKNQNYFSRYLFIKIFLISLAVALITLGLAFYLSQKFVDPINELVDALDEVGSSNYDIKLNQDRNDEFGRLAKRFNQMLENTRSSIKKQTELTRMRGELETANMVQRLFNTASAIDYEKCSVAGSMITASECGGDFWTHFINEDRIFVILGDATGHGTPAALVTSAAVSALNLIKDSKINNLKETFETINKTIFETTKGEIYLTMIAAMIDIKNKKIEIANAGHVPAFYAKNISEVTRWNQFDVLSQQGTPVGREENIKVEMNYLDFTENSRIIFYTDGFYEVADESGKMINDRSLLQLYLSATNKAKTNADVSRFMKSSVQSYLKGENPADDLTIISIST